MNPMKKYTGIETIHENPHLNFYHMDALTDSGRVFDYYFVSRNKRDRLKAETGELRAEGVVIFPLLKEDPDRIIGRVSFFNFAYVF